MGKILQERIKQDSFESIEEEVVLNLLVCTAHIRAQFDNRCAAHRITNGQYNVLRILRGGYPNGYARCDIIARMIEPAPDVTRLIDRLVKDELVIRVPSQTDKRLSMAKISDKGLTLLDTMQQDILMTIQDLCKSLTHDQCQQLSALCELIYSSKQPLNQPQNQRCQQIPL